jgi:hypothetical protein
MFFSPLFRLRPCPRASRGSASDDEFDTRQGCARALYPAELSLPSLVLAVSRSIPSSRPSRRLLGRPVVFLLHCSVETWTWPMASWGMSNERRSRLKHSPGSTLGQGYSRGFGKTVRIWPFSFVVLFRLLVIEETQRATILSRWQRITYIGVSASGYCVFFLSSLKHLNAPVFSSPNPRRTCQTCLPVPLFLSIN